METVRPSAKSPLILVHSQGKIFHVSPAELVKHTGALYIPHLDFANFATLRSIINKNKIVEKKGGFPQEQLWLSTYFQKDLLAASIPDVSLRWIDEEIGWGVFAERDFQPMEYIGEYAGLVRKRKKSDFYNAYCFEYFLSPTNSTPYTIDAQDQGGIVRYLNHSFRPNLCSALSIINGISHVLLFTNKDISKGTQLYYNYGPDYWKSRNTPRDF